MLIKYLYDIFTLFGGTLIAGLIPFFLTPVLSKYYTPIEFGFFTKFQAISSIIFVFVGLRYNNAIIVSKNKNEAQQVLYLSLFITTLISIFLFLILVISSHFINYFDDIKYFNLMLPIYFFLYGINLTFLSYSIKIKKFKFNSISKIINASSTSFSSIILGIYNFSHGLIIGKFIGLFFSISWFFNKSRNLMSYNIDIIKKLAKKYIDFPKYTLIPAFLDTLTLHLVTIIIDLNFNKIILGQYGLMLMILGIPISIVTLSFKDVIYQRLALFSNTGKIKELKDLFYMSLFILFFISLIALILYFVLSEYLFNLFFEEKWFSSLLFSNILIFSFLFRMIVSPLTVVFNVLRKLKLFSIWQIFSFVFTSVVLLTAIYFYDLNIYEFLKIYLIIDLIVYSICLFLQFKILYNLK